jgi:hypothetical protein
MAACLLVANRLALPLRVSFSYLPYLSSRFTSLASQHQIYADPAESIASTRLPLPARFRGTFCGRGKLFSIGRRGSITSHATADYVASSIVHFVRHSCTWQASHGELKNLAAAHLNHEGDPPPLETTVIVHEAFLRLAHGQNPTYVSRSHFSESRPGSCARSRWIVPAPLKSESLSRHLRTALSVSRQTVCRFKPANLFIEVVRWTNYSRSDG